MSEIVGLEESGGGPNARPFGARPDPIPFTATGQALRLPTVGAPVGRGQRMTALADFPLGISPTRAALGVPISDVVELRPEPQMIRPDAWRIVAGVHDDHPRGDGSIDEHPRVPMRSDLVSVDRRPTQDAVAPRAMGARPDPALAARVDLGPEQRIVHWSAGLVQAMDHRPTAFVFFHVVLPQVVVVFVVKSASRAYDSLALGVGSAQPVFEDHNRFAPTTGVHLAPAGDGSQDRLVAEQERHLVLQTRRPASALRAKTGHEKAAPQQPSTEVYARRYVA